MDRHACDCRQTGTVIDPDRTDDLHAYLAPSRRVRRLAASYIEGLYFPSFSVGVVPLAGAEAAGVTATASNNPDRITPKRNGWELMVIRPLRASWKVLGVKDVLTPINAVNPMYPEVKDRNFGSWGISFASDRWDLRRALILESSYKSPDEERQNVATLVPVPFQRPDQPGHLRLLVW